MTELVRVFENQKVNIVREDESILFRGLDVAKVLGYTDTNQAIRNHVDEDDKLIRVENWTGQNRNCIYITEVGLYALILSSKKKGAKRFKRWVFTEILPGMRETGVYTPAVSVRHNQLSIMNERDLHYELVKEIRKRFPNLMLVVPGGELQDTSAKRISMWKKGFVGGQPDIIVVNPHVKYNGMCIELKSPNGRGFLTNKQRTTLDKYRDMGWYVLICDDLVSVVLELSWYVQGVRCICRTCGGEFKSEETLDRHSIGFHRENRYP